jgi:hypothetical protein
MGVIVGVEDENQKSSIDIQQKLDRRIHRRKKIGRDRP